ncbi:MAG: hypothetical protein V7603_1856 [Micromonosporaceae bacterium]
MRLTFLGKDTVNGGSPTLFATDRDSYVVQGWKVPGDELSVEIPDRLLGFLEQGTRLDAALRDTGLSTYIMSGARVTDRDALARMNIPGHETAVEVGMVKEEGADGPVDR